MPTDTEIVRFISSASKSVVVVPSSTRPWRLMVPLQNRSASVSVVFPAPPWPTSATLRILAGGNVFTQHPFAVSGRPPPRTASPTLPRPPGSVEADIHPHGSTNLFDGRFRATVEKGTTPLGSMIRRTGITANHLTGAGLVLAGACAVLIGSGHLGWGLALLIGSSLPDMLDGAVAKASRTASPRGAC